MSTYYTYVLVVPVCGPTECPEGIDDACQAEVCGEERGGVVVRVEVREDDDAKEGHDDADLRKHSRNLLHLMHLHLLYRCFTVKESEKKRKKEKGQIKTS